MTPKCLYGKQRLWDRQSQHTSTGCYLAEHWVGSVSQKDTVKERWEYTRHQHCLLPNRVRDQPSLQDGVISLLQPTHTCSQDQPVSHPRLFPHIHINQSTRTADSILVSSNPPPPLSVNSCLLLSCRRAKVNLDINGYQALFRNVDNLQCWELTEKPYLSPRAPLPTWAACRK